MQQPWFLLEYLVNVFPFTACLFAAIVIVSAMLVDSCPPSCYVLMHLVLFYYLLVLFSPVMLGSGSTCWW